MQKFMALRYELWPQAEVKVTKIDKNSKNINFSKKYFPLLYGLEILHTYCPRLDLLIYGNGITTIEKIGSSIFQNPQIFEKSSFCLVTF